MSVDSQVKPSEEGALSGRVRVENIIPVGKHIPEYQTTASQLILMLQDGRSFILLGVPWEIAGLIGMILNPGKAKRVAEREHRISFYQFLLTTIRKSFNIKEVMLGPRGKEGNLTGTLTYQSLDSNQGFIAVDLYPSSAILVALAQGTLDQVPIYISSDIVRRFQRIFDYPRPMLIVAQPVAMVEDNEI